MANIPELTEEEYEQFWNTIVGIRGAIEELSNKAFPDTVREERRALLREFSIKASLLGFPPAYQKIYKMLIVAFLDLLDRIQSSADSLELDPGATLETVFYGALNTALNTFLDNASPGQLSVNRAIKKTDSIDWIEAISYRFEKFVKDESVSRDEIIQAIEKPRNVDSDRGKTIDKAINRRYRYKTIDIPQQEKTRNISIDKNPHLEPSSEVELPIDRDGIIAGLDPKYKKMYRKDKAANYRKIAEYVLEYQEMPNDDVAKTLGLSPRTIDSWKTDHNKEPLRSLLLSLI